MVPILVFVAVSITEINAEPTAPLMLVT